MAIKFKCKCGQVLSVPDTLAGKQGKCPKCKTALKVPVPKQAAAAGKASASSKAASAQTASSKSAGAKATAKPAAAGAGLASGFDSLFDDAGLIEKTGPTCPSCGVDIRPGAKFCTSCGTNFETGEKMVGVAAVTRVGPEFKNLHLQEAASNMVRDSLLESRRDNASMPWWVLMSFLIGAITLCAAGVVIVDGIFGEPAAETTFIGKVQRLPVFCTLGVTAGVTGIAITTFAHLSICFFAFSRSAAQGLACFFLPLLYSIVYGIMNWKDNKAPVKAMITAAIFIGFGAFLIVQGGGFGRLQALF